MPLPPLLLFGDSGPAARLLDECMRYAKSREPVLLLGPPGVGKSALAAHIHGLSGRTGAFVECSMADVPPNLEYTFFAGHTSGAFTDAKRDQEGAVEAAHGGTLFLDELALASSAVQGVLLAVMERGTVRRLGEWRTRPVDVRVIAATNADLRAMRDEGTFRRDLLGRFSYHKIVLPPLADRRDEILPLVDHYLGTLARAHDRAVPALSQRIRDVLRWAPWYDNVREVIGICSYLVVHAPEQGSLEPDDLPPDFLATLDDVTRSRGTLPLPDLAREALRRTGGNKTRAAKELGISRRHFYRLLS